MSNELVKKVLYYVVHVLKSRRQIMAGNWGAWGDFWAAQNVFSKGENEELLEIELYLDSSHT